MTTDTQILPHEPLLEQQVLGCILTFEHSFDHLIGFFQPDAFFDQRNQEIYKIAKQLADENKPFDYAQITLEMIKRGSLERVGGAYYLTQLYDAATTPQSLEFKARILTENLVRRSLIKQSLETAKQAANPAMDIFNTLATSMMAGENMIGEVTTGTAVPLSELTMKTLVEMENMTHKKDGVTGVPTGFFLLDDAMGGWQKTDLIILAARPGMGKSALAMNMATNACLTHDKNVMVFSLEMSTQQLMYRLYSSQTGIPLNTIIRGKMDINDFRTAQIASEKISKGKMYIDETPSISVYELKAKARTQKNKTGLDLIVIDYLQLMTLGNTAKGMNREQEVAKIAGALKAMAKELDVPVIALSQLSRKAEERANKKPMLSDLRESGAIEQDADIVTFLYRPEYYEQDKENADPGMKGYAEFIVAKNRNGSLDDFPMFFDGPTVKFSQQNSDPSYSAFLPNTQF